MIYIPPRKRRVKRGAQGRKEALPQQLEETNSRSEVAIQRKHPHQAVVTRRQEDNSTADQCLPTNHETEFKGEASTAVSENQTSPQNTDTLTLRGTPSDFAQTQEMSVPVSEGSAGGGNLVSGVQIRLAPTLMPQEETVVDTTATPAHTDSADVGGVAELEAKGVVDPTTVRTGDKVAKDEPRPDYHTADTKIGHDTTNARAAGARTQGEASRMRMHGVNAVKDHEMLATVEPEDRLSFHANTKNALSVNTDSNRAVVGNEDEVSPGAEGKEMTLAPEDRLSLSGSGLLGPAPGDGTPEQSDRTAAAETHVRLVRAVDIPPHQSVAAEVILNVEGPWDAPVLFIPDKATESRTGLSSDDTILQPHGDSRSHVLISNFTGYTQHLQEGEIVGHIEEVDLIANWWTVLVTQTRTPSLSGAHRENTAIGTVSENRSLETCSSHLTSQLKRKRRS